MLPFSARRIALVAIVSTISAPAMAEWYVAQRGGNGAVVYTEASAATAQKPMLAIECGGSRGTSVTVHWQQPMAGYYAQAVLFSIDGSKRRADQWRVSTDHKALGVWGSGANPLARQFLGKGRLSVWATSHRGKLLSAEFALSGLDRALASIASKCNWLGLAAHGTAAR